MMPQRSIHLAGTILLAGALASGLGCAAPPSVFDKAALDGVHSLVVVPLGSTPEPDAGAVAAGMILMRVQRANLPQLTVLEAPALWRVAGAATRPAGSVPDDKAVEIARQAGADAVLTGSAGYAINYGKIPNAPKGLDQMQAMQYQRKFAPRTLATDVTVRVICVPSGRAVYVHTVRKNGACTADLLAGALDDALRPLEDYLRSSRKR